MKRLIAVLCVLVATEAAAQTETQAPDPWPRALYDPGAARSDAPEPDLVLPMPCGAAMAFQRVVVSLDAGDPLADVRIRLGQTGGISGHLDFLRYAYLRGGFEEPDGAATFYYLARYELTTGQYKALNDPEACDFRPGPRETLAQGGLSWFEAVDLSRRYTEWLNAHAPEALPVRDSTPGYLRLPTETEWSFAVRGGESVPPADFASVRFPMDEPVSVYARFDAERLGPVGVARPNPLGLYDMYGNAEEIMLGPFRMNAVGHDHGQPGGMVTRGASYLSGEAEMRSAWRREWSLFGRSGAAQRQDTFGLRLAIAAPVETSDARLTQIRDSFAARLSGSGTDDTAPGADLTAIIRDELDPVRKQALESLQLALQTSRDQAEAARTRQIETTFLASSIFLTSIWEDSDRLSEFADFISVYDEEIAAEEDETIRAELSDYRDQLQSGAEGVAERRDLSLDGYREMLTYLGSDVATETRDTIRAVVARRLTEAGNTALQEALLSSQADTEGVRAAPDMAREDFLAMVLAR